MRLNSNFLVDTNYPSLFWFCLFLENCSLLLCLCPGIVNFFCDWDSIQKLVWHKLPIPIMGLFTFWKIAHLCTAFAHGKLLYNFLVIENQLEFLGWHKLPIPILCLLTFLKHLIFLLPLPSCSNFFSIVIVSQLKNWVDINYPSLTWVCLLFGKLLTFALLLPRCS